MESPVTTLPSSAQSVRADNVRIPQVSFSLTVLFSPAPRPMDFLAPMICPALRIKLGIIRSTITSSNEIAGIRFPNRLVNLSLVMTAL